MRVALLASLLVFGLTPFSHAQGHTMMPYWNAVGPGSYHHASTAEEGITRGMADVIRSQGAKNLMDSEAAINYEDARKKYIENRLQGTQTYFEMKKVNQQYRSAQRKPPPSQQQAIRISQSRLPDRLSANKIDPLTGELAWPLALRSATFNDEREQLDHLYTERADKGFLTPEQYVEVRNLTGEMKDKLQPLAAKLGGNASIEARKFLESLSYEASFQAG